MSANDDFITLETYMYVHVQQRQTMNNQFFIYGPQCGNKMLFLTIWGALGVPIIRLDPSWITYILIYINLHSKYGSNPLRILIIKILNMKKQSPCFCVGGSNPGVPNVNESATNHSGDICTTSKAIKNQIVIGFIYIWCRGGGGSTCNDHN